MRLWIDEIPELNRAEFHGSEIVFTAAVNIFHTNLP